MDRSYSSEVVSCILTAAGPLASSKARRAMCSAARSAGTNAGYAFNPIYVGTYDFYALRRA